MEYYYIDWDKVIKGVKEAVIPIGGFIVAIIAIYYNHLRIKIRLFAVAEQTVGKDYEWSVSLTIYNSGFTPLSIVRVADKNEKEIKLNNVKLPHKLEPGEIKIIIFPYEYSTKNSFIYATDHRGKRHKIKIGKQPPLLVPDSFKEIWTEPNFRTLGHLNRYIIYKFKKQ